MIFRLSQQLTTKIKAGALPRLPLDDNPLADWSAHWFVADRRPYILLSNTKALISMVMQAKGVTNERQFIDRSLSSIKELMQAENKEEVYARSILPVAGSIRFAKALNRSVTGSMNDLVKHVKYWLAQGNVSFADMGMRLSEIPMSALKSRGEPYGFPRDRFKAILNDDEVQQGGPHASGKTLGQGSPGSSDARTVIQHVNRKGDTYYLHKGQTKTGKPMWFFSMRTDGNLVESIPDGYEIYENYMAQVFLRTIVPNLVTRAEIGQVEAAVRDLAHVKYFLVEGKGETIIVYLANQETSFLEEMLASKFGFADREAFAATIEKHLKYLPHMRFTLVDGERRRFVVDRWCFRGSIDDWFSLHASGDLATMVKRFVPHLGQDSFFELM